MKKLLYMGIASLMISNPGQSQGLTLDLTSKVSTDQIVRLEMAVGEPIDLKPIVIDKTKEITIPFNVKRTGYFHLPNEIPKGSPLRINFGKMNPEKGWGLRLAKLDPKDGKVEVTMKMGAFSMSTTKEASPYPDETKVPEAPKGTDGSYVLSLPKPLLPGTYAVIGFNGSSGNFFSKKNGIAWIFEVPASQSVPAVVPVLTKAMPETSEANK